jgi:hypothetical protein
LEAAANRVIVAAMATAISESAGIPIAELEAEAARVLASTPGYSFPERLEWLATDSGIPADEIRRDAAAILAACRAA